MKEQISNLIEENSKLKKKYDKLYKLYTEGTPTDGYEVGPYFESVEEPEGTQFTKEEAEMWDEHLKDSSKIIW